MFHVWIQACIPQRAPHRARGCYQPQTLLMPISVYQKWRGRGMTVTFCHGDSAYRWDITTLSFPARWPAWGHNVLVCPTTICPSIPRLSSAGRPGPHALHTQPWASSGRQKGGMLAGILLTVMSWLLWMALAWKSLCAGALQQRGKERQSVLLLSIRESLKATCRLTEAAAARKFRPPPPSFFFFLMTAMF